MSTPIAQYALWRRPIIAIGRSGAMFLSMFDRRRFYCSLNNNPTMNRVASACCAHALFIAPKTGGLRIVTNPS